MLEKETVTHGAPARGGQLVVDFLYWEGCPSHERALAMVEDALKDGNIRADIRMRRVDTDEEAEALRFPGSPTIRVNGTDIDDDPSLPVGLSCRIYRVNGKMSPLPARDAIAHALREAGERARTDDSDLQACHTGPGGD